MERSDRTKIKMSFPVEINIIISIDLRYISHILAKRDTKMTMSSVERNDLAGQFPAPAVNAASSGELVGKQVVMVDAPHRSLAKAISWRLTGTIDTIVVSLVVTRHLGVALSIGSIELFTKLTLYYFHERLWNRLAFGRAKLKDDYQI
jgi:uncharacterized membrane protein